MDIDLPYPWERHYSNEYQTYYYYNLETDASSWDLPFGLHPDDKNPQTNNSDGFVDNEYTEDDGGEIDYDEQQVSAYIARMNLQHVDDQDDFTTDSNIDSSASLLEPPPPPVVEFEAEAARTATTAAATSVVRKPSIVKQFDVVKRSERMLQNKQEKIEKMKSELERKQQQEEAYQVLKY